MAGEAASARRKAAAGRRRDGMASSVVAAFRREKSTNAADVAEARQRAPPATRPRESAAVATLGFGGGFDAFAATTTPSDANAERRSFGLVELAPSPAGSPGAPWPGVLSAQSESLVEPGEAPYTVRGRRAAASTRRAPACPAARSSRREPVGRRRRRTRRQRADGPFPIRSADRDVSRCVAEVICAVKDFRSLCMELYARAASPRRHSPSSLAVVTRRSCSS